MPIKLTLKVMLARREMTQKELADAAGIRLPTISAICTNAAKHLPIEVINKICETLDCSPGDWIERQLNDDLVKTYTYFEAPKGTEAYDIISSFVYNQTYNIGDFENKLGLTDCLDMDLYENGSYFLVVQMPRQKIFDVEIHSDLKKVQFDEFLKLLGDKYTRYGFVGTGTFYQQVLADMP